MNKFQKVGVAVAVFGTMAFAQLWKVDSPYGQVQFPWILECQNRGGDDPFDEENSNDPCYKDYGGWWFGYLAGWEPTGEVGPKVCIGAPGMPEDGGNKSAINTVQALLRDPADPSADPKWISFIGPDYEDVCEGPAVTDKTNGHSLMSADGLDLKLTIGDGFPGLDKENYEPSIAGVAVSLTMDPKKPQNVANKKGFCLTYISDHKNNANVAGDNTGAEMQLELGWDEGIKANQVKAYDSWYAKIPESDGAVKKVDFSWEGTPQITCTSPPKMNTVGDFMQDNYTCWDSNHGKIPGPFPISSAIDSLVQVKIRLKGYEAQTVNFKLIEFGWLGECTGETLPVVKGVRPANFVGFDMVGRTLSMNYPAGKKPLAVQVINLQGAVVKTQTMSNGDKLNLQNLPTGIYMIRVPSLGYTVKQIVK